MNILYSTNVIKNYIDSARVNIELAECLYEAGERSGACAVIQRSSDAISMVDFYLGLGCDSAHSDELVPLQVALFSKDEQCFELVFFGVEKMRSLKFLSKEDALWAIERNGWSLLECNDQEAGFSQIG